MFTTKFLGYTKYLWTIVSEIVIVITHSSYNNHGFCLDRLVSRELDREQNLLNASLVLLCNLVLSCAFIVEVDSKVS